MSTPVDADTLSAIVAAAESAGAGLHLLRPDQVYDLATAADQAQRAEVEDVAWQAELGYWTGGIRLLGSGIPDAAIGDRAPQTTVPGRDFGRHGDLPISEAHENAATFAPPNRGKLRASQLPTRLPGAPGRYPNPARTVRPVGHLADNR
ncbi:hypothetical protein ACFQFC_35560 [Amorphoplanes digitatis]|uniref:Uncharacterized protein n=1 Tax=Actinoplanes digitatis TaxID=1868 RepID=A0A7W7HVI3_9ACTN|nr:hypothetical protein [Actinoplanes digitatis]MBB4761478.1 hypothetical protein [Actinoplanes digitatis]BFE69981.1 hypothetical protein GCM10020092_032820 [Actinoplanes digitatis]GID97676.1 hypothetical protein Adi01nite_70880 [Actinoplanes digitatis]